MGMHTNRYAYIRAAQIERNHNTYTTIAIMSVFCLNLSYTRRSWLRRKTHIRIELRKRHKYIDIDQWHINLQCCQHGEASFPDLVVCDVIWEWSYHSEWARDHDRDHRRPPLQQSYGVWPSWPESHRHQLWAEILWEGGSRGIVPSLKLHS